MILVTGATGQLGGGVVDFLLQRLSASKIAIAVKSPDKAQRFSKLGIDVRHGDFGDPAGLERAFSGAERLLLVSASGIDHESRAALHRNAIHAAVRAGVGRVYYTSLIHADDSIAYVMKAHPDTEEALRASGLRFTILRNGIYADAWKTYLGDISQGEVVVPTDGPVAWVSRTDLAEATARVLAEPNLAEQVMTLTGPEACNIAAFAEALHETLGIALVRRIVSLEEYVARTIATGKTEEWARQWATTYFAMARGEFVGVDPALAMLLGRRPRTVNDVLRKSAA